MDRYKGKVLLITNTASRCGLTPQYEGLQNLHDQYNDQGFEVLAFPSNNFMGQEPLQGQELQAFCSTNYGATYPVFERIDVKGRNAHPLFKFLAQQTTSPKWNFHKYLINRNGEVVTHFIPLTVPENPKIIRQIEEALGEEALV